MDNDLDTLVAALYVSTDDLLRARPDLGPRGPWTGWALRISDAELVVLCVMQALLGFTSERRWRRHVASALPGMFPHLPAQPGYNKRLRKLAGVMQIVIAHLGQDTSLWSDDVWVADSTPVECGRSRETVHRCELAGWAEYGYCASHSRYFWGLRLHLLCTLHGLPVGFALTDAKADERQTLLGILEDTPCPGLPGQAIIADKGYVAAGFESQLGTAGITLLRPARKDERPRPGQRLFKPLRQVIESINATLKSQLDLETHSARTIAGVTIRVLQRILALTAAICHNHKTSQPILRSLTTYDH